MLIWFLSFQYLTDGGKAGDASDDRNHKLPRRDPLAVLVVIAVVGEVVADRAPRHAIRLIILAAK
jgi:hypothetical protein